jgi:hypothetical protein
VQAGAAVRWRDTGFFSFSAIEKGRLMAAFFVFTLYL